MTGNPGGVTAPLPARVRRPRTTSPRVHLVDRVTTWGISIGGVAVIAAVLGILVYLVAVVAPLFRGARLDSARPLDTEPYAGSVPPVLAEVDEYQQAGLLLFADGRLRLFDARTGATASEQTLALPPGAGISRFVREPGGRSALALSDGSLLLATLGFQARLLPKGVAAASGSVASLTPQGDSRETQLLARIDAPVPGPPTRVAALDLRHGGDSTRLALWNADGPRILELTEQEDLLTGAQTLDAASHPLPLPAGRSAAPPPAFFLTTTRGDQVYAAWGDGDTLRWDTRRLEAPVAAEETDLVADPAAALTALRFMNGEQSLLSGDSQGGVTAWFRVPGGHGTSDGMHLAPAKHFATGGSAVTALAVSQRDKTFGAGFADGGVALFHLTSQRLLAQAPDPLGAPIVSLAIAPKSDGVLALDHSGALALRALDNPHPESSIRSIFGSVWYEGYGQPGFTWQSSSGTDDFEPKMSLIPLIFGTLKATLYAMLFAVPIALAAAIYTSEFLDRKIRAPIKSLIETMASLPSVVLGFIAAMVLAPFVERWVMAVLLLFGLVPVVALGFGTLWQALPRRVTLRATARGQLMLLFGLLIFSGLIARSLGPVLEALVFDGEFFAWLAGNTGSGAPGIAGLAWFPVFIALVLFDRRWLSDWTEQRARGAGAPFPPALHLARYGLLVAASVALAALFGVCGAALGLDPRGGLLDTYAQKNAMIVGFVMGFAVIPIIYTIAEDALSSVPDSLRSASLGCGATRWQTATRVILPVATSGIFSALMIGLGRAVGETMIVLMAAGNTPILSLNPFNGLRTLSANIAVELPEAVQGGTLYRMLFLAAMTLFLLTSVLNTVAEIVRQRFRKKAFQL